MTGERWRTTGSPEQQRWPEIEMRIHADTRPVHVIAVPATFGPTACFSLIHAELAMTIHRLTTSFRVLLFAILLFPALAHGAEDPGVTPGSGPVAAHRDPPPIPGACGPGSLCAPPVVDPWPQDAPPPPGYHASSKPNPYLTDLGWSVFGLPYFTGFAVMALDQSLASDHKMDPALAWLMLPLAGPFVELAYVKDSRVLTDVLIADGAMQALGLGLWVAGRIIWPDKIVVRDDVLAVVPRPMLFAGGGGGIGVQGSF
ncbi:MAG TPA: hypothetical protein VGI39_45720 [Polyangiaceae bacterium]|jgi:hypothetical protein